MAASRGERKPLIGITIGREGDFYRLRYEYAMAVAGAGGTAVFIPPVGEPASVASEISGLLIPGGKDIDPSYYAEKPHPLTQPVPRERTDFEFRLLEAIMEEGKPVLGVCYGMQAINVALGGSLYQDVRTQVPGAFDHGEGEHRIEAHGPYLEGSLTVNTSHHQAVKRLGKGLAICAWAGDGVIEAVFLQQYPFLLGVQWHPERSGSVESGRIFNIFVRSAHDR